MGTIVPHKFPKFFATDKDGKKTPVENPSDCPTVDPEDAAKQGKELKNSTGKRGHYLLASPPTPGQEINTRPGFLGPPPPAITSQRCPPLQIWPPAELVSSTSGDVSDVNVEDETDEEVDAVIRNGE